MNTSYEQMYDCNKCPNESNHNTIIHIKPNGDVLSKVNKLNLNNNPFTAKNNKKKQKSNVRRKVEQKVNQKDIFFLSPDMLAKKIEYLFFNIVKDADEFDKKNDRDAVTPGICEKTASSSRKLSAIPLLTASQYKALYPELSNHLKGAYIRTPNIDHNIYSVINTPSIKIAKKLANTTVEELYLANSPLFGEGLSSNN